VICDSTPLTIGDVREWDQRGCFSDEIGLLDHIPNGIDVRIACYIRRIDRYASVGAECEIGRTCKRCVGPDSNGGYDELTFYHATVSQSDTPFMHLCHRSSCHYGYAMPNELLFDQNRKLWIECREYLVTGLNHRDHHLMTSQVLSGLQTDKTGTHNDCCTWYTSDIVDDKCRVLDRTQYSHALRPRNVRTKWHCAWAEYEFVIL
jgi:hypothetical protein